MQRTHWLWYLGQINGEIEKDRIHTIMKRILYNHKIPLKYKEKFYMVFIRLKMVYDSE